MTDREIVEFCTASGFAVSRVARRRGVLLLAPVSFEELPAAADLAELGRRLRIAAGVMFVALDLEELS